MISYCRYGIKKKEHRKYNILVPKKVLRLVSLISNLHRSSLTSVRTTELKNCDAQQEEFIKMRIHWKKIQRKC